MSRENRWLGGAAIAAVVALGLALGLRPDGDTPLAAQDTSYTIVLDEANGDNGSMTYLVDVIIEDPDNDHTAYKAENDARIDTWAAHPELAPPTDGRPVKVTFYSPRTYSETLQVVGPYASSYLSWQIVGFSLSHPERLTSGWDEIDPALFGVIENPHCGFSPEPDSCEPITNTGLTEVQFAFQGGISDLVALKANPTVFLADTTAIKVAYDLATTEGIALEQIQQFVLPAPMYDSRVTFP